MFGHGKGFNNFVPKSMFTRAQEVNVETVMDFIKNLDI